MLKRFEMYLLPKQYTATDWIQKHLRETGCLLLSQTVKEIWNDYKNTTFLITFLKLFFIKNVYDNKWVFIIFKYMNNYFKISEF